MTQYEVLKDKKVKVTGIKNRSYEKENNLYVDRVVLKVEDKEIPKGKITINPEVKEVKVERKKVDGTEVPNEIKEDRDPTVREVFSEFPRIKQLFKAVEDFGEIEIKGLVRAVRDDKNSDWNFFIRTNELDKLEASKIQDEPGTSTADKFVEDQTNIETEKEDLKTEESDVIFGENKNE